VRETERDFEAFLRLLDGDFVYSSFKGDDTSVVFVERLLGLPAPLPEVLEERLDEEEETFLRGDDSRSSGCKKGSPTASLAEDPFFALLKIVDTFSGSSEAIDPSSSDEDICLDLRDSSSLTLLLLEDAFVLLEGDFV
jgi:hypothetical protein